MLVLLEAKVSLTRACEKRVVPWVSSAGANLLFVLKGDFFMFSRSCKRFVVL